MSLMSVMFSSMAKRIYLMSSGHQYLLTGSTLLSSPLFTDGYFLFQISQHLTSDQPVFHIISWLLYRDGKVM